MLMIVSIGALLIAATTAMHAVGTTAWMRVLITYFAGPGDDWRPRRSLVVLSSTAIVFVALHIAEIILWAIAYRQLVPDQLPTLESAVYFSFVTYTTLGYGDITLDEGWRLLSGIESINGILLAGWTTAMLFGIVQRTWRSQRDRDAAGTQR
jgi:voltage-gated potassium channel